MSIESQYTRRLSTVIKRARPLSKRIKSRNTSCFGETDEIKELLVDWQSSISDSKIVFQKRLALDGLANCSVDRILMVDDPLDEDEVANLEWLAELLSERSAIEPEFTDSETPFFDLLLPFAVKAMRQLDSSVWSCKARTELVEGLTQRLSEFATPVLFKEFDAFRSCEDEKSRLGYLRFVRQLWSGGWTDLFERYPVLARLIASESRKWDRHLVEVETRIRCDGDTIERELVIPSGGLFPIMSAVATGDMHDGRCVLALTAKNGQRLIYKPRSMILECQLNELLDKLNRTPNAGKLQFGKARAVSCDGYGYQEYVCQKECSDYVSVSRAFYNYGGLLAVLHLLGATDGHFENVIVAGEVPYFVDAETLLQSDSMPFSFRCDSRQVPHTFAGDYWLPSVQRVGILPAIHIVPDVADESGAIDYSSLGYVAPGKVMASHFVNTNTDAMTIARMLQKRTPGANVVSLGGNAIQPTAYSAEIADGYRDAIECALEFIDQSTLDLFSGIRSRTIFRSTHLYAKALWHSVQPDSLSSGVRHSLVFEPLAVPFCTDGGIPDRWGIFKEEVAQMENLDVPRFERETSGKSLYCTATNVEINNFFAETGIESAQERLRFTPADVRRNVGIINAALEASVEQKCDPTLMEYTPACSGDNLAELRAGYQLIVEHILRTAVFTTNGSVNWICKQKVPQSERFSYRPLGDSFYNGRLGVSCFLAAANLKMPDSRIQNVVSGVLREITEIARNHTWLKATVNTFGGGITGAGGLLYALLCISQLTKDSKHIETAANLACEIASSGVYKRWGIDFFDGVAGYLFTLARLHSSFPDDRFESALKNGVSEILGKLASGDPLRVCSGNAPITPEGLAHGTAGVGLALIEAFCCTGETELSQRGTGLLEAELAVPIDRRKFMSQSICRGSSGLSIARRLASRSVVLPELSVLESPAQLQLSPDMTLCCGRAGQWLASNSDDSKTLTLDLSSKKIPNLAAPVHCHTGEDVSLFRGMSGIGWVLLQRSEDYEIPNLFEFGIDCSRENRTTSSRLRSNDHETH